LILDPLLICCWPSNESAGQKSAKNQKNTKPRSSDICCSQSSLTKIPTKVRKEWDFVWRTAFYKLIVLSSFPGNIGVPEKILVFLLPLFLWAKRSDG
jgi:hypothetical protein